MYPGLQKIKATTAGLLKDLPIYSDSYYLQATEDSYLANPHTGTEWLIYSKYEVFTSNSKSGPVDMTSIYIGPVLLQEDLRKWLRTNHNIHISIYRNEDGYNKYAWRLDNPYCRSTEWYDSYEEALEFGLVKAIKRVKGES